MADLTTIILTYNEEKNIEECIASIKNISKRIIIVDSYSTDKTTEVAGRLGAEVFSHQFKNYAKQFIWALDSANIQTKWVLRFDADERLTEQSANEIACLTEKNSNTDINGLIIRFEVNFLGRKLHHGGIYPFRKLLVFKYGKAYMEDRHMDEHIVLSEGKSIELKSDSLHCDYKDLSAWIEKHNKYSNREVIDYFERESKAGDHRSLNLSAKIKRLIKNKIYYRLPMGTRAHLYYWYRYYVKLGFLDGREGKIFAFLQAYWYRYLVDAKIYEQQKKINRNGDQK